VKEASAENEKMWLIPSVFAFGKSTFLGEEGPSPSLRDSSRKKRQGSGNKGTDFI